MRGRERKGKKGMEGDGRDGGAGGRLLRNGDGKGKERGNDGRERREEGEGERMKGGQEVCPVNEKKIVPAPLVAVAFVRYITRPTTKFKE